MGPADELVAGTETVWAYSYFTPKTATPRLKSSALNAVRALNDTMRSHQNEPTTNTKLRTASSYPIQKTARLG